MKRCSRCKVTKPLAEFMGNGTERVRCHPCRAYVATWRRDNSERTKEYDTAQNRRWREANPDKVAALQERRRNDPDQVATSKAHYKRYYAANRERLLEKNRKWLLENPDKKRASRDREKSRHYANKRRALKLAASTGEPVLFDAILQRDCGLCGICGGSVMEATAELDHIIPLAAGGAHAPDNVQLAHRSCNRRKFTSVAA